MTRISWVYYFWSKVNQGIIKNTNYQEKSFSLNIQSNFFQKLTKFNLISRWSKKVPILKSNVIVSNLKFGKLFIFIRYLWYMILSTSSSFGCWALSRNQNLHNRVKNHLHSVWWSRKLFHWCRRRLKMLNFFISIKWVHFNTCSFSSRFQVTTFEKRFVLTYFLLLSKT